MSKIDPNKIRRKGIVIKRHGQDYRVELENDTEILATVANKFRVPRKLGRGNMKPHVSVGDKVIVEINVNQTKIERGDVVAFY